LNSQGREGFYHNLPKPLRIAFTFVIVLFGWVFSALPICPAPSPLVSMFGLGHTEPSAAFSGDYLQSLLPALDRYRRARGVGRKQTWDWTQHDASENGGLFRARLAGVSRPGHTGIQPVYLFHFLGTERGRRNSRSIVGGEEPRKPRARSFRVTASRRPKRTGNFRAKKKRTRPKAHRLTPGTRWLLIALFLLTITRFRDRACSRTSFSSAFGGLATFDVYKTLPGLGEKSEPSGADGPHGISSARRGLRPRRSRSKASRSFRVAAARVQSVLTGKLRIGNEQFIWPRCVAFLSSTSIHHRSAISRSVPDGAARVTESTGSGEAIVDFGINSQRAGLVDCDARAHEAGHRRK
jgi:hypothetical protein